MHDFNRERRTTSLCHNDEFEAIFISTSLSPSLLDVTMLFQNNLQFDVTMLFQNNLQVPPYLEREIWIVVVFQM